MDEAEINQHQHALDLIVLKRVAEGYVEAAEMYMVAPAGDPSATERIKAAVVALCTEAGHHADKYLEGR